MHVILVCPTYMVFNLYGSLTIQKFKDKNKQGGVYGAEKWNTNPILTIFGFISVALIQGILFYLSCMLLNKLTSTKNRSEEAVD